MSFQDNFFLGFELEHRFYALPIAAVDHVFYQEASAQLSHILKIDEMIVFEGEPYYLSKPNKVLPIGLLQDTEAHHTTHQQASILNSKLPWVIILKNEKSTALKKGLGFRVQQIINPFELSDVQSKPTQTNHTHAGREYQVILI